MSQMTQRKPDLIIRKGTVIDGTGAPAFSADVAVADDRVIAVGDLAKVSAGAEIDAHDKMVAPGFIDVHTHDDRALLALPLMECKISQGVTSVVTGNCGVSLAPLAARERPPPPLDLIGNRAEHFFARFSDYLAALERDPPAVNALCQVGHSSLRVGAMDRLDRPATEAEIALMRARLEQALDDGAIGLSTGLFYPPANAAPAAEVIALATVLKGYGGIHSTHMRDETDHVMESLEETFAIGKAAGIPVVISHHKCAGVANHGRSRETLARIDRARAEQAVGLDVYPYVAGSTVLDARRMMGASRVLITWSEAMPEAAGRELADIAADLGCSLADAAARLHPAGAIYFMMDEADVRRILAYPHSMIGSDGLPHDIHPHPRLWGTFPRVLGHYAREVGLFSLEEAVRKMTSLPAQRFGLIERGLVREGSYADLVVFDPKTVVDRASFEQPMRPAAGIDTVLVNGRVVWRDGLPSGARPGRVVRRQELRRQEEGFASYR